MNDSQKLIIAKKILLGFDRLGRAEIVEGKAIFVKNNKITSGGNKRIPHCLLKAMQAITTPVMSTVFIRGLKTVFSFFKIINKNKLMKNKIYGSPRIIDKVL